MCVLLFGFFNRLAHQNHRPEFVGLMSMGPRELESSWTDRNGSVTDQR